MVKYKYLKLFVSVPLNNLIMMMVTQRGKYVASLLPEGVSLTHLSGSLLWGTAGDSP